MSNLEEVQRRAAKIQLLCFGASLTAGFYRGNRDKVYYFPYANELQILFDGNCIVDYIGLCGFATSEMVAEKNREEVFDHCDNQWKGLECQLNQEGKSYDYVLILVGRNDLNKGVAVEEVLCNLEILVQTCLNK